MATDHPRAACTPWRPSRQPNGDLCCSATWTNKYPMDARFEVDVTMRQWMECCACSCEGEDAFHQPGWCGHKIDGSRKRGGGLGLGSLGHRRARELFEATVDWTRWDHEPCTGYD
jgi:hypothetical protein